MRSFKFDNEEFAYSEEHVNDNYCYRVCVKNDGQFLEVLIGPIGVVIDFFEENYFIHTNIVPNSIFGKQQRLEKEQIKAIIELVISTGLEGKKFERNLKFKKTK